MKRPHLQRAAQLNQSTPDRVFLWISSIVSAFATPLLIVVLGLVVQIVVDQEHGGKTHADQASKLVLGDWITFSNWPFLGRYDYCLLILLASGLATSMLISLTFYFLNREIHHASFRVVGALKEGLHRQASRTGSSDIVESNGLHPETLFTKDVELTRQGVATRWHAIPYAVVSLASLLVLAFAVDFLLAILAVLMALMVWRTYVWLGERSDHISAQWEDRRVHRHDRLLEGLRIAPLTHLYSRQRNAESNFLESLRSYLVAALKSRGRDVFVAPVLLFVVLFAAGCLLLVLGLSDPPRTTVAGMVVLGTALICAYFPALELYILRRSLDKPEAAAQRIFAFLDREPRVSQVSGATALERLQSGIQLDHVTVADSKGHKILEEISMQVPVGGRVGILSSDPRTSDVLAGLFVRFYDPALGRVLFDNRDIRNVTLDSLRQQAALVRCENALFTGEVSENIDCGDSRFSLLQITDAAKRAGAYDFIQQLPQGFSTIVGDQGERLGPLDVFRISLSRAVLRDPSLLLIEEPDGDDEESVKLIDETLTDIASGRTLIYFPNRLATLRSLDRVFLFHEGRLCAAGHHTELIQSSDLYRHLNYVRFNPYRTSKN